MENQNFPYKTCKRFVDDFQPRHKSLSKIHPVTEAKTVRDAVKTVMKLFPVDEPGPDTLEVYEERRDDYAYFMAVNCARGSVCYVFRKPDIRKQENERWPVMVASLYSTETPVNFAWLCMYAACYYNRCLIAPESKSGAGQSFVTEIWDYPYFMHMTAESGVNRKTTRKLGFDTNARTHTNALNKVKKWINEHDQESGLYHLQLLKEMLNEASGKGRPDRPERMKDGCLMAFAVLLWTWDEERSQVTNNRPTPKKDNRTLHSILKPYADHVSNCPT